MQCNVVCVHGFSCFGDAQCKNGECQCTSRFNGSACQYDLALPELRTFSCWPQSFGGSRDLTGLTWCRGDNPTISPLRLPPPKDPKSIAFEVPPCDDETNPNATCRAVVKVSSIGWRRDEAYYSFVLSGLQDGHFVAASFNNDSVRHPPYMENFLRPN